MALDSRGQNCAHSASGSQHACQAACACVQVLAVWRLEAGRKAEQRSLVAWGLAHSRSTTLSTALHEWQAIAAWRRQDKRIIRGFQIRLCRRMLSCMWDAWRSHFLHRQHRRASLLRAVASRQGTVLRSCLHFWRAHAQDGADLRGRLRQATGRRLRRSLTRAFAQWAQRAKRDAAVKAKLRVVLYRVLAARLTAAFAAWCAAAASRRWERAAVRAAVLRLQQQARRFPFNWMIAIGPSCSCPVLKTDECVVFNICMQPKPRTSCLRRAFMQHGMPGASGACMQQQSRQSGGKQSITGQLAQSKQPLTSGARRLALLGTTGRSIFYSGLFTSVCAPHMKRCSLCTMPVAIPPLAVCTQCGSCDFPCHVGFCGLEGACRAQEAAEGAAGSSAPAAATGSIEACI